MALAHNHCQMILVIRMTLATHVNSNNDGSKSLLNATIVQVNDPIATHQCCVRKVAFHC